MPNVPARGKAPRAQAVLGASWRQSLARVARWVCVCRCGHQPCTRAAASSRPSGQEKPVGGFRSGLPPPCRGRPQWRPCPAAGWRVWQLRGREGGHGPVGAGARTRLQPCAPTDGEKLSSVTDGGGAGAAPATQRAEDSSESREDEQAVSGAVRVAGAGGRPAPSALTLAPSLPQPEGGDPRTLFPGAPGRPPPLNLTHQAPPWREEVSCPPGRRGGGRGPGAQAQRPLPAVQGPGEPARVRGLVRRRRGPPAEEPALPALPAREARGPGRPRGRAGGPGRGP